MARQFAKVSFFVAEYLAQPAGWIVMRCTQKADGVTDYFRMGIYASQRAAEIHVHAENTIQKALEEMQARDE